MYYCTGINKSALLNQAGYSNTDPYIFRVFCGINAHDAYLQIIAYARNQLSPPRKLLKETHLALDQAQKKKRKALDRSPLFAWPGVWAGFVTLLSVVCVPKGTLACIKVHRP